MISATLVEAFTTQYGHGIKVRTSDGQERKAFGKGPPPQIAPGATVTFNLNQKGRSYYYSNLVAQHPYAVAPAGWPVATSPMPGYTPSPGPQPPPAFQPPKRPEATAKDARMMFVTRVTGDAMSSGQFGIGDITTLALAANAAYDALMKSPIERTAGMADRMDEPPPPQGEGDYGGDAPPEW